MGTPAFSSVTSTSAWVNIRGWQSGIRSLVRLAAAIPAMRAISSGFPLGFSGSLCSTAGVMRTKACARAVRVTIVLIDDHAILRQGLRSLLEREHDLQVVGEASSPREALAVVQRTRPAIVLLDMKLSPASDNDGLGVCARLTKRYPELSVLVLSTFVDDALVVSAIQHGARGFVVKDVDTLELVRSIRLVARKGSAFDSRSAAAMMRSIHAPQARSPLTDPEQLKRA